jgi:hypothetical protein
MQLERQGGLGGGPGGIEEKHADPNRIPVSSRTEPALSIPNNLIVRGVTQNAFSQRGGDGEQIEEKKKGTRGGHVKGMSRFSLRY